MKTVLLFILNGMLLLVAAQQEPMLTAGVPSLNLRPIAQTASMPVLPPYDLKKIDRNLKLDRRLIISGAVLTGVGGVIFGVGLASMFVGRADENFLAFALLMTGAPLIGCGVPLLGVGLAQRHKWRMRKNEFDVHAGVLSNAHLGLVMNY